MQIEGRPKERFIKEQPYKLSLWLNNPKHNLMTKKVMQKLALSLPPLGGAGGGRRRAPQALPLSLPGGEGWPGSRCEGCQGDKREGCEGCQGDKREGCEGCQGKAEQGGRSAAMCEQSERLRLSCLPVEPLGDLAALPPPWVPSRPSSWAPPPGREAGRYTISVYCPL